MRGQSGESRGRLLLVEDNPANIHLFETVLTNSGYEVDIADTGEKAVAFAALRDYSLILMDIGLPLISGLEAARRIRAAAYPQTTTPIIALTASDELSTVRKCAEVGMSGFLNKPLSPFVLLNAINAMLRTQNRYSA